MKREPGGLIITIISLACIAAQILGYLGKWNPTLMVIVLVVAAGAILIVFLVTGVAEEKERTGNQKEKKGEMR